MKIKKGGRKKTAKVSVAKKAPQPKAKPVSFHLTAPEAKSVTVTGAFNNWDPQANPLRKGKEGVWKTNLRLQPGTYQYKFVLDGEEWREDPLNPNKVPNPHGSFNSVCEVV